MRWDPLTDTHAHMDVSDYLGPRLGLTADECREELGRRTAFLTGLSAEGILSVGQVRNALATYRRAALTGEDLPVEIGGQEAPPIAATTFGDKTGLNHRDTEGTDGAKGHLENVFHTASSISSPCSLCLCGKDRNPREARW